MRNSARRLAILALALSPCLSRAGGDRFDGKWQTTVSCEPSRGALGFSYQFLAKVKGGSFHGLHGTEDQPGYLMIDGAIGDDGSASLYARGKTNGKEYTPGRDVATGTEYGYHIKAQFNDRNGTGTRVEGRPCTFEFERK
jgi:hypothetical protein